MVAVGVRAVAAAGHGCKRQLWTMEPSTGGEYN